MEAHMANIKPVSYLRNYASVLKSVSAGEPLYLTRNGRGAYAVVDMADYEDFEKTKAALRLMCELQKGKQSGEDEGWLSESAVKKHFKARFDLDKKRRGNFKSEHPDEK